MRGKLQISNTSAAWSRRQAVYFLVALQATLRAGETQGLAILFSWFQHVLRNAGGVSLCDWQRFGAREPQVLHDGHAGLNGGCPSDI